MEALQPIWHIIVIAAVAGGIIGALAYRFFAPAVKQASKAQSDLEAAQEELADYKASVSEHFEKTSELVNEMTQNYVKVYQHLAEGSQSLGDGRRFNNLLEQQSGKVALTVDEASVLTDEPAPEAADVDLGPAVKPEEVDEHAQPFVAAQPAASTTAEAEPTAAPAEPASEEANTVASYPADDHSEPEKFVDTLVMEESPEKPAPTKDESKDEFVDTVVMADALDKPAKKKTEADAVDVDMTLTDSDAKTEISQTRH